MREPQVKAGDAARCYWQVVLAFKALHCVATVDPALGHLR